MHMAQTRRLQEGRCPLLVIASSVPRSRKPLRSPRSLNPTRPRFRFCARKTGNCALLTPDGTIRRSRKAPPFRPKGGGQPYLSYFALLAEGFPSSAPKQIRNAGDGPQMFLDRKRPRQAGAKLACFAGSHPQQSNSARGDWFQKRVKAPHQALIVFGMRDLIGCRAGTTKTKGT